MCRNQIVSRLFFSILFLLISSVSQAAPTVHLKSGIGKYNLGLYADILEDKRGELTIEQVSSPAYHSQWTQSQQSQPNFAFSESVFWMRITLTSQMPQPKTMLLETVFALNDYIDFYLLYGGRILSVVKTGDRLPFNTRQVNFRNFLFKVDIPPDETRNIYLRFQSHDGLHEPCPIILWDQEAFGLANGIRNLGFGLYFGTMLAMAIYNLFIFLSVRDRGYAYYVIYIIGVVFWLASYSGYSFQYLWPNSPNWANQMIIVTTSFWAIFMIQFVRYFLDTKRLVPWFEKLAQWGIGGFIFNMLFTFTGKYAIGVKILVVFGIILCIAGIIIGAICFRAGFRPARYFLLAWTTLLLSIVIFVLKIAGILPAVLIVEKSIQIGSMIEVMLLSLGLADRINELKKDKLLAQAEAISAFESSLKLKTDFITSITHELRTPMNAILGGLEVVQKQRQKNQATALDIVKSGASDMMNLVNDILTHTEIQSDRLTIQSNPVATRELLKSLHECYFYWCKGLGLQLVWQVDPTLPEWIYTDEEKLVIIMCKLLDNAAKFTEKGQVAFTIKSDQAGQLKCIVQDTGIGISQEKLVSIFESFTQSEGGLQRRYGGLGIGLSICKRLTEAMGGELTVESLEGQGSTFTITVPFEPGVEPVIEKNTNLASADLPILIVEDNIVNQRVMIKLLEKLGYKSLVASNGKEALEILGKEDLSLILMDLQMPVMDGLTCTAKIREREDPLKNIPIIAVTANLMDADKERCIKCGMNDFIKKPVNLNILRNSLLSYIEPATTTDKKDPQLKIINL